MAKSAEPTPPAKTAKRGERMLEVRVPFWTNHLAEAKGSVWPKHAWSSGVVHMERNDTHGLAPIAPLPFGSLLELPRAIERVLNSNKVVLHESRVRHYMAPALDKGGPG